MTSYIFQTEEKAKKFKNAAEGLGFTTELVGAVVIADKGAIRAVTSNYYVYEEDAPVYTGELN